MAKQKPIDIEKLAEKYKDLPPVKEKDFEDLVKKTLKLKPKKPKNG